MGITVNTSPQQITASVGETQIDVSVSGGFGPSGNAGAAGQAASVTVGTVTTGAAGSQASVTNVGTSSAAVLNFTIPAGATGATGPAGPTGPAGTTTWSGLTGTPTTLAGYGITDAAASSHNHAASDITSGVIATARLASSGTADNTTFLRGDGAWATPSGASVAVLSDTVASTSYIGQAPPGSATSASVWKIRRTVLTSAGAVSSTATATNVKWDDRLTASYS